MSKRRARRWYRIRKRNEQLSRLESPALPEARQHPFRVGYMVPYIVDERFNPRPVKRKA
jgi:hypothetical protein